MHKGPGRTTYNPAIMFFVPVLVLASIIVSHFLGPLIGILCVLGAMIGMMLIGKPFLLSMMLFVWVSLAFVVNSIFPSRVLNRVDDVLVICMFCSLFGSIALRRTSRIPYAKIYLFTLGTALVSWVFNRSPAANMALFMLAYCSPFLIFCLLYPINFPKIHNLVSKLIISFFIIGLGLNAGWLLGVNPIPNIHRGTLDFAKGTLGGCDLVAYFTVFIMFFSYSHFRNAKSTGKKAGYLALIGAALIQLYLTYTAHVYFYLALLVPMYFFITKQKLRSLLGFALLAIIFSAGAIAAGTHLASKRQVYAASYNMDFQTLEMRWRQFLRQPKIEVYQRVITKGSKNGFIEWIIGHGPGAGTGTIARTAPTPYTFEILGDIYLTASGRASMEGSSVTQHPFSGPTSLWSEIGMAGTVLFYILPLIPAANVFKRLRAGSYPKGSLQLVFAEGFVMYLAIFYLMNVMNDYWSVKSFTCLLWVLCVLALKSSSERASVPNAERILKTGHFRSDRPA